MKFLRLTILSQHAEPKRRLASSGVLRFQIQRWRWLKTMNGLLRILRKWMRVLAMNKRLALITYYMLH